MSNVEVGRAPDRDGKVRRHGPEAFAGMRKAGQLAAAALDMLAGHVKPGVTTEELDELALRFALDHNAYPAPLNYRGFPKSICTSINHVVCHGIPGPKPLRDGDIVNIDVTLIVDGWHGDTSRMYPGRPYLATRRAADFRHLRGAAARYRRGSPRCHHRTHRCRHPGLRRGRALLHRARFLRPRPWPRIP